MPGQAEIVEAVRGQTLWWITQRRAKILEARGDSMSINPFLLPLISGLHGFGSSAEVGAFLLGGHLFTGHNTGFGKLIDEKILPAAFGTVKLTRAERTSRGFSDPMYDDIDHLVPREGTDGPDLLSLKAGRWTIQLNQAVGLNDSFNRLVVAKSAGRAHFDRITLATFYGSRDDLTDKYFLAQGSVNAHHVIDLTHHVDVLAGKEFWSWLNGGEDQTQAWVMEGIIAGMGDGAESLSESAAAVQAFEASVAARFERHIDPVDGSIDWAALLEEINP